MTSEKVLAVMSSLEEEEEARRPPLAWLGEACSPCLSRLQSFLSTPRVNTSTLSSTESTLRMDFLGVLCS